jgi:hypothetical protein
LEPGRSSDLRVPTDLLEKALALKQGRLMLAIARNRVVAVERG